MKNWDLFFALAEELGMEEMAKELGFKMPDYQLNDCLDLIVREYRLVEKLEHLNK